MWPAGCVEVPLSTSKSDFLSGASGALGGGGACSPPNLSLIKPASVNKLSSRSGSLFKICILKNNINGVKSS